MHKSDIRLSKIKFQAVCTSLISVQFIYQTKTSYLENYRRSNLEIEVSYLQYYAKQEAYKSHRSPELQFLYLRNKTL